MNVSSLDKMEEIVTTNKSLSWDGWTVLESKADDAAWMKVNAAFIKNKWHRVNRYEPNENGWTIPDRLVK
jgi:hypothetical protein